MKIKEAPDKRITGYKGFDKDMQCRGIQYVIGETTTAPSASLCKEGLHFCEYPLDVLGYYPPADSKYAEVEGINPTNERHREDSKRVTTELKIKADISIPALVKASVDFILSKITKTDSNTGYMSAATNTGYMSASEVSGNDSIAIVTGIKGKAKASKGSWIVLTEREYRNDGTWSIKNMQCAMIDGNYLKEDIFYTLVDNQITEATDED